MDDGQLIHWVARRVAIMAQDLRAEAPRVQARTAVAWQGRSAQQYRSLLDERAGDYRRLAGDLDRLHATLLAHARHVEAHEAALGSALGAFAGPARVLTEALL